MKIKSILLILTALSATGIFAQSPSWKWAKAIIGTTIPSQVQNGKSIATDAAGNFYITGTFQGPGIVFGNITLTGSGFFIAKYDSLGNVIWAKTENGTARAEGTGICTDPAGNVYVTGKFRDLVKFDSIELKTVNGERLFIVKYNSSNGKAIWAKAPPPKPNTLAVNDSYGTSINTDARGNVYVTGSYQNSICFDDVTLINSDSTPGRHENMFHVKYTNSGEVIWAKTSQSKGKCIGNGIVADANGNSYVTGSFSYQVTFGTISLTGSNRNESAFILKYDQTGNELWAKSSGQYPSSGNGKGISKDGNDNVYLTGDFDSPILNFGNDTITNTTQGFDMRDIFIAKLNSAGDVLWLKSAGSELFDEARNISTDKDGNSYITGYFNAAMALDNVHVYSEGGRDGFIAKYTDSGKALWAKKIGGAMTEYSNDISVNANGNVYVIGTFISPYLDFDNIKLPNADKWGSGNSEDIFIARIDGNGKIGIKEKNKKQFYLTAYPNPFNMNTTIKFNATIKNGEFKIYTLCGKLVKQLTQVYGDQLKIERENLAPGMYIYHLAADDTDFGTGKLIITD
jgi:hypothetical protein